MDEDLSKAEKVGAGDVLDTTVDVLSKATITTGVVASVAPIFALYAAVQIVRAPFAAAASVSNWERERAVKKLTKQFAKEQARSAAQVAKRRAQREATASVTKPIQSPKLGEVEPKHGQEIRSALAMLGLIGLGLLVLVVFGGGR
jgi:hypothetical protein